MGRSASYFTQTLSVYNLALLALIQQKQNCEHCREEVVADSGYTMFTAKCPSIAGISIGDRNTLAKASLSSSGPS